MEATISPSTQRRESLGFDEYQIIAESTDQNRGAGHSGMSFYLLGLFGETGSLLAELKKNLRDERAYSDYRAGVLEEFGDVLWYLTNATSRTGSTLAALARETDGSDANVQEPLQETGKQSRMTPNSDLSSDKFERLLIALGGQAGGILNDFDAGLFESDGRLFQKRLAGFYKMLSQTAKVGRVDLHEAAALNVKKIKDRWPGVDAKPTPLFDDQFDIEEQLPREIDVLFMEKRIDGKSYVIQKCNGIKIGDRLTDNMVEDDGYRYHDIFHLSYAAILGWSPVVRALFKSKRKSNKVVDEVEDGARAVIIEEGVSTWVFNYAIQQAFFEGVKVIDYDLLKRIRALVKGFEVERCSLWEWEKAILSGFEAFRELRRNNGGLIRANLRNRTLIYEARA